MSLGKLTAIVLEGNFYARVAFLILWGVLFSFGVGVWLFAASFFFFSVSRLPSTEYVSREKEALARVCNLGLVAGLLKVARTCQKVAGPWKVVLSLRKI